MIFLHYKIKEFLENLKRALDVAIMDAIIKAALLAQGWDDTILNRGLQLHQTAHTLYVQQIKEKGEQVVAYKKFEALFDEVNEMYMYHIKLCRIVCRKNKAKLKELTLNVPRERTINGWLIQAKAFYANVLKDEELITQLSIYVITREILEAGEQKIFELETAKEQHDIETGEAQDATRLRNEAVEEANQFAIAFIAICKIALKDRPEQLEKMRIKHYSDGYKKKSKQQEEPETQLEEDVEELEDNPEDQF